MVVRRNRFDGNTEIPSKERIPTNMQVVKKGCFEKSNDCFWDTMTTKMMKTTTTTTTTTTMTTMATTTTRTAWFCVSS
jgi:hypothetical protein